MYEILEAIYKNISIPVIVCEDDGDMTIAFANTEAYLLLNPSLAVERLSAHTPSRMPLSDIMRFHAESEQENIRQMLIAAGSLSPYTTTLLTVDNTAVPVTLAANMVRYRGRAYTVIYILDAEKDHPGNGSDDVLIFILNTAYHATDIDLAVQSILARAGEYIGVSRVYVFEDLFNN